LLRNLAIGLIQEERITTTVTRAKELRRLAERLVTYAKRGGLHGRRLIIANLGNSPDAARKLIGEIAPRFAQRSGGYTRAVKTGLRRGDAAPTVLIEWVQGKNTATKKAGGTKARAKGGKPTAAPEPEA
jgi:large subunit ribosomal protein L17